MRSNITKTGQFEINEVHLIVEDERELFKLHYGSFCSLKLWCLWPYKQFILLNFPFSSSLDKKLLRISCGSSWVIKNFSFTFNYCSIKIISIAVQGDEEEDINNMVEWSINWLKICYVYTKNNWILSRVEAPVWNTFDRPAGNILLIIWSNSINEAVTKFVVILTSRSSLFGILCLFNLGFALLFFGFYTRGRSLIT